MYTSLFFFCFFQAPAKQTTRRSGEMIMSISYSLSGVLDSPKIIFLNLALKNNCSFVLSLFKHVFIAPNEFVPVPVVPGTEHSQLGAQAPWIIPVDVS